MAGNSGFAHEAPNRGATNEWYTPPSIFDALGLEFDLDPCAPLTGKSYVPARHSFTIEDDGLVQDWFGLVWCNPPYGKETGVWLQKLADHGEGIALVFNRSDTRWFQRVAPRADLLCFTAGRVRFIDGSTGLQGATPAAGSVLLAFGERSRAALLNSNLGIMLENVNRVL